MMSLPVQPGSCLGPATECRVESDASLRFAYGGQIRYVESLSLAQQTNKQTNKQNMTSELTSSLSLLSMCVPSLHCLAFAIICSSHDSHKHIM